MSTLIQRSFAGGEVSPSLYARVDTVKYATGLRQCKNFLVMRHGGVANRPGTSFVGEVEDSTSTVKLIPFIFNADQTYVLEFGHLYMRVIRNGAYVLNTAQSITGSGVTNANPAILEYSGSDNYVVGDEIYISGIVGPMGTYLNGRNFKVNAVNTGTNKITLGYMDGTNVDSTLFGAWTSGGTIEEVYTISTPYVERDLQDLKFVESADVVTIAHQNYAPRELSRTAHTSWTLSTITFAPSLSAPANPANNGAAGSATVWVVTAVASETLEESLQSATTGSSATPTSGAPITITWDIVTGAQEYNVYKRSNGIYGLIGIAGSNSFVDNGITPDTSDTPPVSRNPFALESQKFVNTISQTNPGIVATIDPHGYQTGDLIYMDTGGDMTQINDRYFFIIKTGNSSFTLLDLNNDPVNTTSYTPYTTGGAVQRAHNYPATVTYIQQRRGFANTRNDTETVWLSRSSQFKNFTVSSPIQDDDAVTFTMAGRQVNEVRDIFEIGSPVVMTSGGEWSLQGEGGETGVLKPTAINPKQQSYNGSGSVSPLIIDSNAIYVQARGSIVRDLGFDFQSDGYRGNDLTIFASHLVDGYTIVDWAFQKTPYSIVWAVRDDGTMIGLTYVREHQVWGWHRHEFEDAVIENVCVVPEGNEDVLYLVVNRTIDGVEKRYVERMHTRRVDDIVDSVFCESSLSYDGRNEAATTMTLSALSLTVTGVTKASPAVVTYTGNDPTNGDTFAFSAVVGMTELNGNTYMVANVNAGANTFELRTVANVDVNSSAYGTYTSGGVAAQQWTYNNTLKLTASASYFASTSVGNQVFLDIVEDGEVTDRIRFDILTYSSATVIYGRPNKTVPADLRTIAITDWAEAVDQLGGLWHLEGKDVSIFADGFVVGSPHNAANTIVTVTNGSITLDQPYSVIHVGLPITADLELLDIDSTNSETLVGKQKIVNKVNMTVESSRGIWVGAQPPSDDEDDPLEGLYELKIRDSESYDEPVALQTGNIEVQIQGVYNSNGRVFIRQVDPLPLAVLAVAPEGMFPFRGGG